MLFLLVQLLGPLLNSVLLHRGSHATFSKFPSGITLPKHTLSYDLIIYSSIHVKPFLKCNFILLLLGMSSAHLVSYFFFPNSSLYFDKAVALRVVWNNTETRHVPLPTSPNGSILQNHSTVSHLHQHKDSSCCLG